MNWSTLSHVRLIAFIAKTSLQSREFAEKGKSEERYKERRIQEEFKDGDEQRQRLKEPVRSARSREDYTASGNRN
jgi:hypothetical protein